MSQILPVLLDTDIGTNIDDALALAYLLRQPRCELLGISTVTGDVAKRAACAEVVCRAAGKPDVPIHCGASRPLLFGVGQDAVPLYDAVRSRPHRADRPAGTAVEFLRGAIRRRPGEITLITIGPHTNIALLFALDPELPSLLRQVVSMAGIYRAEGREVETNCRVDPLAAAMVFNSRPPRHNCIGLDVTRQCGMPSEEVRRRIAAAGFEPVSNMLVAWSSTRPEVVFHDPLAAAVVFRPDVCRFDPGRISIELDPASSHVGRTRLAVRQSEAPSHHVAATVDSAGFFREYFGVFTSSVPQ